MSARDIVLKSVTLEVTLMKICIFISFHTCHFAIVPFATCLCHFYILTFFFYCCFLERIQQQIYPSANTKMLPLIYSSHTHTLYLITLPLNVIDIHKKEIKWLWGSVFLQAQSYFNMCLKCILNVLMITKFKQCFLTCCRSTRQKRKKRTQWRLWWVCFNSKFSNC